MATDLRFVSSLYGDEDQSNLLLLQLCYKAGTALNGCSLRKHNEARRRRLGNRVNLVKGRGNRLGTVWGYFIRLY